MAWILLTLNPAPLFAASMSEGLGRSFSKVFLIYKMGLVVIFISEQLARTGCIQSTWHRA